jgi:hypothetical protein
MVLQGNKRTRFSLNTAHDVNTLPRILEILTIRDIAPEMISLRRQGTFQVIELDLIDLSDHDILVMENKMRQVIMVQSVKSETLVSNYASTLLTAA